MYPVRRWSAKDGKQTRDHDVKPGDLTADVLRSVYDVNVSSRLGAFGAMTDPDSYQYPVFAPAYGSSQPAVSMLTVQYAKVLPELRINAIEPGLTATDLYGRSGSGVQTPAEGTKYVTPPATWPFGECSGSAGVDETTWHSSTATASHTSG